MAYGIFNPTSFLVRLDPLLLEQYSQERNIKFKAKKKENAQQMAERFNLALEEHEERDEVWVELRKVEEMANDRGFSYLYENTQAIGKPISKKNMDELKNHHERSLWFLLNHPEVFRDTSEIYELDYITGWRRVQVVGRKKKFVAERTKQFEQALQHYFQKEFRGKRCKVEYYDRGDRIFMGAFVEDLPTNDITFEKNNLNKNKPRKPVFEAYFLYRPKEAILEVKVRGGKKRVQAMQKIFAKEVLDTDISPDDELAYDFDKLKDLDRLNFPVEPSDGIESVQLKGLRLYYPGDDIKLSLDVGNDPRDGGVGVIKDLIDELSLTLEDLSVHQAVIKVKFRKRKNEGRQKSVTFRLTQPNACDLRERKQDRKVRKLLKRWKLDTR